MSKIVECVPNFSEARRPEVVAQIRKTLKPASFPLGKTMTMKHVTEHHADGVGSNACGSVPCGTSEATCDRSPATFCATVMNACACGESGAPATTRAAQVSSSRAKPSGRSAKLAIDLRPQHAAVVQKKILAEAGDIQQRRHRAGSARMQRTAPPTALGPDHLGTSPCVRREPDVAVAEAAEKALAVPAGAPGPPP